MKPREDYVPFLAYIPSTYLGRYVHVRMHSG